MPGGGRQVCGFAGVTQKRFLQRIGGLFKSIIFFCSCTIRHIFEKFPCYGEEGNEMTKCSDEEAKELSVMLYGMLEWGESKVFPHTTPIFF